MDRCNTASRPVAIVLGLVLRMTTLTSAAAFVTTSTGAPRRSPVHRAEEIALNIAGEEAATAPPKLLVGERDFETFVGRYRVRSRGDSDSLVHAEGGRLLLFGVGEEEDVAGALRGGFDCGIGSDGAGGGPCGDVLVVEEDSQAAIGGGGGGRPLAFVGAIDSLAPAVTAAAATTPKSAAYVSVREGQEMDESTASLLVRALRGWSARLGGAGRQAEGAEGGGGEVVDWVDTTGRVICALPRGTVHSHNVLHRGAGVMIRNDEGEVYCHRRTSTKRVFPSMYDMFIGGVSGTMEPAATTALRELGEELGLGPYASGSSVEGRASAAAAAAAARGRGVLLPASMRYRGECLVKTGHNRCVVSVFDYLVAPGETVRWQEEEVDWGSYLPWREVVSKVSEGDWAFVPDGLQVWRHYLEWEAAAAAAAPAAATSDR